MQADKHRRILDCAAEAFARFGFRKTSIADIAADARVAKGTVYLAATSKQDLFYQVLHREVREGVAAVGQLIDARKSAESLLATVLEADCQHYDTRPLIRELLVGEAAVAVPDQSVEFSELRRLARSNLRDVVRLGQRQGVFRTDIEADLAAELMQDIQVATLLFHDAPGLSEASHPRWQTTVQIFVRGLRVAASSTAIDAAAFTGCALRTQPVNP